MKMNKDLLAKFAAGGTAAVLVVTGLVGDALRALGLTGDTINLSNQTAIADEVIESGSGLGGTENENSDQMNSGSSTQKPKSAAQEKITEGYQEVRGFGDMLSLTALTNPYYWEHYVQGEIPEAFKNQIKVGQLHEVKEGETNNSFVDEFLDMWLNINTFNIDEEGNPYPYPVYFISRLGLSNKEQLVCEADFVTNMIAFQVKDTVASNDNSSVWRSLSPYGYFSYVNDYIQSLKNKGELAIDPALQNAIDTYISECEENGISKELPEGQKYLPMTENDKNLFRQIFGIQNLELSESNSDQSHVLSDVKCMAKGMEKTWSPIAPISGKSLV